MLEAKSGRCLQALAGYEGSGWGCPGGQSRARAPGRRAGDARGAGGAALPLPGGCQLPAAPLITGGGTAPPGLRAHRGDIRVGRS